MGPHNRGPPKLRRRPRHLSSPRRYQIQTDNMPSPCCPASPAMVVQEGSIRLKIRESANVFPRMGRIAC